MAEVAKPRVAAPPACRAGAPLRRALGSKSSLCTYSRVLPRLRRINGKGERDSKSERDGERDRAGGTARVGERARARG